jgi:hypothetical protein
MCPRTCLGQILVLCESPVERHRLIEVCKQRWQPCHAVEELGRAGMVLDGHGIEPFDVTSTPSTLAEIQYGGARRGWRSSHRGLIARCDDGCVGVGR